jgi:hypothetical protein
LDATKTAQGDLARTLDSPTNKMRVMITQIQQIAVEMGTNLIPTFAAVLKASEPLLVGLRNLTEWFTNLSPQMQTNIIVIIGLVAALGPLATIVGSIITLIPVITGLISGLGIAIGILSGPVGIAILAFIAFAAVAKTIYDNWDKVTTFLKNWYPAIALALLGPLPGLVALIIQHWDDIANISNKIWSEMVPKAVKWGSDLIQGLIDGINSKVAPVINIAKDLANRFTGTLGKIWQLGSPSKVMKKIGSDLFSGLIEGLTEGNSRLMQTLSSLSSGAGGGSKTLSALGNVPGTIGAIAQAALKVKDIFAGITGSGAKKEFRADIQKQSEANLAAVEKEMEAYKNYATAIRNFGQASLVSIMGLADATTRMLETMDLEATGETISKKIKTFFGLGRSTTNTTLWTYTFDKIGAESAQAWLDRFMQIASGLSSSVGSAFSSGIKDFLSGKTDWIKTLQDGIKNAIIDAITTAVMQATIIKGALGGLLGELATGLTAGEDVTGIIGRIAGIIPTVATQLQTVLTPLRDAVSNAFPTGGRIGGGVDPRQLPSMASGGIVSRPTMAMVGDVPEAIIPLSRMNGGEQMMTINVQLDGRVLTQSVVKYMPNVLRIKTGVAL